jgi:sulfur transfer protein SufE
VELTDIQAKLKTSNSWQEKYRQIMLLGKTLPPPAESLLEEKNRVSGCESNVWLTVDVSSSNVDLQLWSDSKVVKGLLAIVLSVYQNKTVQEVKGTKLKSILEELGISRHLSDSRNNGLNAINEAIQQAVD